MSGSIDQRSTPTSSDPVLVRFGVRYFRDLSSKRRPAEAIDAVHFLNADERRALRRIERGAILRAAVAGALSTIGAAGIEVAFAIPLYGHRNATLHDDLRYYAIVGVATIITSIIEIGYLYWDGLSAVHDLSSAAGLDLFPEQDDDKALASAMARAALELPNPTASLFGVDPHREASRLRLFVASIAYKLKVSVTNFLLKALVRRALGRAFVRGWLPFVAVPITAAWNAFVCWLIVREARIRAMGPSAAREMIAIALGAAPELSSVAKAATLRAVASSIVRTEDLHPNLAALLHETARVMLRQDIDPRARLEIEDGAGALDDSRAFLRCLAALEASEQSVVLRVLAIASIIDGRLTRNERRLLSEARAACGLDPRDLSSVERLRRAFIDGDPIDATHLTA